LGRLNWLNNLNLPKAKTRCTSALNF